MRKSNSITRVPQELLTLESAFLSEIMAPEPLPPALDLPFFNFVCCVADLLQQFARSPLEISFNLFLLDYHMRKYTQVGELCRRFLGLVGSWKRFVQTDEGKLLLTCLKEGRNDKTSVKLFLKLRKTLLKNLNQKVLQQISLTHEDAVTVVHTISVISLEQRKTLTKKINEYFITKNFKFVNNTKFNAAIICEYFMQELTQRKIKPRQTIEIQEFGEESISMKEASFSEDTIANAIELKKQWKDRSQDKQNEGRSLVSLQKCMLELNFLKQKDMEIDNRFRRVVKQ